MFENLQDKLDGAFKNLTGDGKLTELNVATSIKEIRPDPYRDRDLIKENQSKEIGIPRNAMDIYNYKT